MQQVVFITGASRGIGKSIAEMFSEQGHIVYGCGRTPFVNSLFHTLVMDITSPDQVNQSLADIIKRHGRIDVIVNNAGYDLYGSFEGTSEEEMRAQMETNFFGTLNVIRATIPYMKKQGSGRIVTIGSIGGIMAIPFNSVYSASKFALEGFLESLRFELAPYRIHILLVEPQSVRTNSLELSIQKTKNERLEYNASVLKMVRKMKSDGESKGIDQDLLATKVVSLSQVKRPKFRYPVGRLVSSIRFVKLLLPERFFFRFIQQNFLKGE